MQCAQLQQVLLALLTNDDCYLCIDDVVLDLVLSNWIVFQNDMQPHRHHTSQPVDQTGIDFCGHPPLHRHTSTETCCNTRLLTCIT